MILACKYFLKNFWIIKCQILKVIFYSKFYNLGKTLNNVDNAFIVFQNNVK